MNYVDYIERMLRDAAADPERAELAGSVQRLLDAAPGGWRERMADEDEEVQHVMASRVEHLLFPEFFRLLGRLSEFDDPPADELMRAIEMAPPRFFEAAEAALRAVMPRPCGVTTEGAPLFSLDDMGRKLGADPDALMATCDELGITPHAGPAHHLN